MMRGRAGMTLLELVVALVITGMMASVGGMAFGSIIDHRRAIVQATVTTERASALRETVHAWLVAGNILVQAGGLPQLGGRGGRSATTTLQTTSPGSSTPTVQSVTPAVATGDELDFTTVAPNPAMSNQASMRLFIDGDASTPETGLTLEYKAGNQSPTLRRQLDPSIGSMTVEYLDTRTNQWFPASQASTITPHAMRLTFGPADGYTLSPILRIPIVIPMGQQAQLQLGGRGG
jgi:prepilin-type N-terminal cleavage/methylation domain-containing protein